MAMDIACRKRIAFAADSGLGVGMDSRDLRQLFDRMAERASAGLSLHDFLASVHDLLKPLIQSRNFYVCLYNREQQRLDFPYYVDERDGNMFRGQNVPLKRGLTEYVLRTESPQLISASRFAHLRDTGEITQASGDLSFSVWLGVPIFIDGLVGGVLVVQSYDPDGAYSSADIGLISSVANQFGLAIERYQAIENLRQSEARYRALFENIGVGVTVVRHQRFVFINPAMVHICGHDRETLLASPFTFIVHPEDLQVVQQRHDKRLRGEPVESYYGFRIRTASGEVRWLELSGALVPWEGEQATVLFVVDVSSRVHAQESERLAIRRQAELNHLKSRFIAMASHELRTPLTSIRGSVDLLRNYADRLSPERQQQMLASIDEAVSRMTHMLENVLQAGRAEAAPLEFRPQTVPIRELCQSVIDEVRSTKADLWRQRDVFIDLPPEDVQWQIDPQLWRNILGNLLANAIKYSFEGGAVRLQITVQPSAPTPHLLLSLTDEGIGIAQQDLPELYTPFHRGINVGTVQGTGLGLSIVKDSIDRHGGTIEMQSEVGVGTRFTVRIPQPELAA